MNIMEKLEKNIRVLAQNVSVPELIEEVTIRQIQLDIVAGLLEGMLNNPSKWETYIPQLADWLEEYKEKEREKQDGT